MYPLIKQSHRILKTSFSYYCCLLDCCFLLKSLNLATCVHAHLVKLGFNGFTFLGNRCFDVYSQFGSFDDSLKVFEEIRIKNVVSWNICLKAMLKFGYIELACDLFDRMPQRDVVSWNSMISGYAKFGCFPHAFGAFREMQSIGLRPCGFTYSIMLSVVDCVCHVKELHGSMIRNGWSGANVVLGNSLINMYGTLGALDFALAVFSTMEEVDVISWNSLISVCCKSGYSELGLNQFSLMRSSGYCPDEFTYSAAFTACTDLWNLDKGKQIFALCVKLGFLCNSIISSALIDLFSKCNRLEESIKLFEEQDQWDSAVCNSMISSYAWHGFGEDALKLFVLTMREDIRPSEFTLTSVLSSIPCLLVEAGTQVHSLVIKLGFSLDAIVASSLVHMYSKLGSIDSATRIFNQMVDRDLISWNAMIMGLTHNSRVFDTLETFGELLRKGPSPDRVTLAGVLLACNYGCFVDEGMSIFSSMREIFGVQPGREHYDLIVDLLCIGGRLDEAIEIAEEMPHEPSFMAWESILRACTIHGNLKLAERVAERLIEYHPLSSTSGLVLAQIYEMRGEWDSLVRIQKAMRRKGMKKVMGCSWIGIRNHVYTFNADTLQQHGGKDLYSVLGLLDSEMEIDGYFSVA